MVRAPYIGKNGIKKGAWSEEEDNRLRAFVQRYGHRNWRQLPQIAGLARCGKSCRLRWLNYLKPGVRRGNYTSKEDDMILELYREFGTRWALIGSKLPGRTDNEIKNHWHSNLWRRLNHENKSKTAAGETPVLHRDANNCYEDNLSDSRDTSDSSSNKGRTGNIYQDEVSSVYQDPTAALINDTSALDWAVLAETLSPVEEIINPFSESFWSNNDPFFFDASHDYTNIVQWPPLMDGYEVMCPNYVEEDDDIIWLHDLFNDYSS